MTRRDWLATASSAPLLAQTAATTEPSWLSAVIDRHDKSADLILRRQITDPSHRWRGIYPDDYGIFGPGAAAGIIDTLTSCWLHPRSRHHKSNELAQRALLAVDLLRREQTSDGNWHLPVTNFNSPPDTGFIIRAIAPAAGLLKRGGHRDLFAPVEPVLLRAGAGMAKGGVHTPNHRWVVSAALAQLDDLFGRQEYVRRIEQWLAEGIDLDSDDQWTERSTYVYNPITDAAFVTMAAKLKRPQLLDPARRNLRSMMYLLHPGYEVVTEISRRQDLNIRGDMGPYWFSLAFLAEADKDGRFATLAEHFAPKRALLSALMEYPQLLRSIPAAAVPDSYTKAFPHNQLVHVRRGPMSAVVLGGNRDRVFTFRNGDAVIQAVRFASAFFGKGQFAGAAIDSNDGAWTISQQLEGPYYQPLDPPQKVDADSWAETRAGRTRSEVSKLTQSVAIRREGDAFTLRIRSEGTADVPLAVEISLREGGRLDGVEPALRVSDGYVLKDGRHAIYRAGSDAVRFGPGTHAHMYTQVRGAQPKLPGNSVYLTGFTPFDHTIRFEPAT